MGKSKRIANIEDLTRQLIERGNDAYTPDEYALVADGLKEIAQDERRATLYERFLAAILYTRWADHPTLKRERITVDDHPSFPDEPYQPKRSLNEFGE